MSNITIPNSFASFTVAVAADVNANFTEIATKFNTYAVQKDVNATITAVHTYSTAPVFGFATASQALELDASKNVQSVAITGTGNYVKSASPTFTGTITAVAGTFSGTVTVNSRIIAGTDSSTAGSVVLQGVYSSGASAVWGTEQSSGGPVAGCAVRPDTAGPDAFLSTVPASNLPRGAYTIAGADHKWFSGAAQIVAVDSAVTMTKVMQVSTSNLNVFVPIIAEKDSAEVDIFLRRTGTNALDVYLYNTGVGAGYYDGTNLRTVWNYNPATAAFTFGATTLDVSDAIAQIKASPTSGLYTGSAFQSIVTRAASTAFDHFYATANSVVVARIRGDGSALFAQAVAISAGGLTVSGNTTIDGTHYVTSTASVQSAVRYDSSNRLDISVSSAGAVTFDAVGASAGFTFSDAVTVNGAATFNGNVTLGDATSDTLTITARLVSSIVPSTSGTRSLGADTLRFQNGYIDSWYANNGTFESGAIDTSTQLLFRSSGGSVSCLRMPHGSAPSSPVNGDMWTTAAGLFVRINGVTVGPLS